MEKTIDISNLKRGKTKTILLFLLIILLIFACIIYFTLFSLQPLYASELNITVQQENEINYFYVNWVTKGGHQSGDLDQRQPYLDFERGIVWRDYHFQLSASKWNQFWHDGIARLYWPKLYNNGKCKDAENYVRYDDDEGISRNLELRYARVYYDNPDGTSVLIWECEDFRK